MRSLGWLFALVAACSFAPVQAPGTSDGGHAAADGGSSSGRDGVAVSVDASVGDAGGTAVWPCGTMPASPSSTVGTLNGGTGWDARQIMVAGALSGTPQLAVAAANQPISLSFTYDVARSCGGGQQCDLQLEIGTDIGGKTGCVWNGKVTGGGGPLSFGLHSDSWNGSVMLGGSNVYQIRLADSTAGGCPSSWSGTPPDDHSTIAIVCVP